MDYERLRKHLMFFLDATGNDDAKKSIVFHIKSGFSSQVQQDLSFVSRFIESDPDREELREFVAYEMNRDYSDPTGEADFQWLSRARDTIAAALKETGFPTEPVSESN